MSGVSQTIVASQATAITIGKRINSCCRSVACIFAVKRAYGNRCHRLRSDKPCQRANRDAGVRAAIVDLICSATTANTQWLGRDHRIVCGVRQAVVVRQTTIGTISQRVHSRCCACASILVIKGAHY